jgi:hypothetical protein
MEQRLLILGGGGFLRLDQYLDLVAGLPCVLCEHKLGLKTYGCEVHHPTVPRNDWLVVPLCAEHHRGPTGVHGRHRRGFESLWKVTDYMLLGWTNQSLARNT